MGVEGFDGIAQGHAQAAGVDEGAAIVDIGKAFHDRATRFHITEDLAHHDLRNGMRQFQPTVSTTLSVQITQLCQLVDDLGEMIFRGVAATRNLGFGDQTTFVDAAIHQNAHGEVGAFCNPHSVRPFRRCGLETH